jgi:hypothetical protein
MISGCSRLEVFNKVIAMGVCVLDTELPDTTEIFEFWHVENGYKWCLMDPPCPSCVRKEN